MYNRSIREVNAVDELWNRLLGIMPNRPALLLAIMSFLLIIIAHYLNEWVKRVTEPPWKSKENQRNRKEILGEMKKNEQQGQLSD